MKKLKFYDSRNFYVRQEKGIDIERVRWSKAEGQIYSANIQ